VGAREPAEAEWCFGSFDPVANRSQAAAQPSHTGSHGLTMLLTHISPTEQGSSIQTLESVNADQLAACSFFGLN
jgi:hypothetical protein